jgi:hypothetical protein
MSAFVPAGNSRSLPVTIIGVVCLLCGLGYLVVGGHLILGVAGWFAQPDPDSQVIAPVALLAAPLLILFGVLFLVLGFVDVLAALGILLRKQWGRILTFVAAGLAIVLGLLWLSGVNDIVQDATDFAVGAVQILFGVAAIIILSIKRAEFSAPRI